MTKKLICALLLISSLAIAGCGTGKKDSDKEKPSLKDRQEEQTVKDESGDNDVKSDKKDKKKKKKKDDTAKISFTYQNQPVEATYNDKIFTLGGYYTIQLDEETRDEYPELAEITDKYNLKTEKEVKEFVEGSKPELLEMWNESFTGYYEEDYYLYPVRADKKVFSFVEECYSFYGGAHGTTAFSGYNFDPVTGREIEFEDVVKDTSNLPGIIVDELIDQNPDLKDYFNELPSDKENLLNGIPGRLDDNAKGLSWAIDYDGIRINFEDYAMGSYAVGTQEVKISFKDYPDIFTDNYTDYEDGRVPDIKDSAKKLEDAEKIELKPEIEDNSSDRDEKPVAVNIIDLSKDDQYKVNLFISNFAEQGFLFYDEKDIDVSALAEFAYRWSKINKYSNIEVEGNYYKISLDKVKNITGKYFETKLTDDDLYGHDWDKSMFGAFCKGGYYYVPAADGESYTTFAVVEQAEDAGDDTLWLYFTTYELDLDVYWDNDEVIPKKYYSMTAKEAADAKELTSGYQGMAIVKKDKDSYKLMYYKQY